MQAAGRRAEDPRDGHRDAPEGEDLQDVRRHGDAARQRRSVQDAVREGAGAEPVRVLHLGQVRGAGEVAHGDGAHASHLRARRRHGPARPAGDFVEIVHRFRDGGGRTRAVQGAVRAPVGPHAARQGVDLVRAVRATRHGGQQRRRRRRRRRRG